MSIKENNNQQDNWKKQLSVIHRRTPVRSVGKDNSNSYSNNNNSNNSNNNNNKVSRREEYFREISDHSLIFADPALSIFDLSTPKYKMTSYDNNTNNNNNNNNNNNINNININSDSTVINNGMSTPYWDNSIYRSTPETKIIDYMSNIQALDNETDINIHTPSRQSQPETPNSRETSSFLTKNVIKTLNFGASIDGDMSMILKETDESINELSDDDDDDDNNDNNSNNANNSNNDNHDNNKQKYNQKQIQENYDEDTFEQSVSELNAPTKDISPDSAILKESELKGELLTKFSRNILSSPLINNNNNNNNGNTPINIDSIKTKETVVISPNQDKEVCEFTKHLTANLKNNEIIQDSSFIDAVSANDSNSKNNSVKNEQTNIITNLNSITNTNTKQKILDQNSLHKENRVNQQEITEGLVDEWKETKTPQGKIYFYNRRTRQSAWKLPNDAVYIPTGNGAYRIFSSRVEKETNNNNNNNNINKYNDPEMQSHPLITPIKIEPKIEEVKINTTNKVNNPPILQTPPRSRPNSNVNTVATTTSGITSTGSSPRQGVAFIKKNDESKLKNENYIHCPFCGTTIDMIDHDHHNNFELKCQAHLNQCLNIEKKSTKSKNSDLQKLLILQKCLTKVIDGMKITTPINYVPSYNPNSNTNNHSNNTSKIQDHIESTPKSSNYSKRNERESPSPNQRNTNYSTIYDNNSENTGTHQQRLRSPSYEERLIVLQPTPVETPVTITANLSNPTSQQHKTKKNEYSTATTTTTGSGGGGTATNLLSATTPLTFHSRETPRDEHKNQGKTIQSCSIYVCPSCTVSLKNREELVNHLKICPQLGGDITSTRSDSYLVRSNTSTPNQKPMRLYHHDDGSVKKENHKVGSCPFCGKIPSSSSSLSSHLLNCQKKKESQERRESPLNKNNLNEKQLNSQKNSHTQRGSSPSPSSSSPGTNYKVQTRSERSLSATTNRGSSVPHTSRIVPFR